MKKSEITNIDKFPDEGCCNVSENNTYIFNKISQYLKKTRIEIDSTAKYSLKIKGIAWNSNSYWYYSTSSDKTLYNACSIVLQIDREESPNLILGKYLPGDIIVFLPVSQFQGKIVEVLQFSSKNNLKFKERKEGKIWSTSEESYVRKVTKEEYHEYLYNDITNINQIGDRESEMFGNFVHGKHVKIKKNHFKQCYQSNVIYLSLNNFGYWKEMNTVFEIKLLGVKHDNPFEKVAYLVDSNGKQACYPIDSLELVETENSSDSEKKEKMNVSDPNYFPKGSYVVLLQDCQGRNDWAEQIPVNYCYKLRDDSNTFCFNIELDIEGSTDNGWQMKPDPKRFNLLKLRAATQDEIDMYILLGKPFDVTACKFQYNEVSEGRYIKIPETGEIKKVIKHYYTGVVLLEGEKSIRDIHLINQPSMLKDGYELLPLDFKLSENVIENIKMFENDNLEEEDDNTSYNVSSEVLVSNISLSDETEEFDLSSSISIINDLDHLLYLSKNTEF